MLKRAPTELLAGVANKIRPRSRGEEFELADGGRIPFSLSEGDEVETDSDSGNGKPSPLKGRLLEIRERRDKIAAAKPRQKGAFKLPPQSLLDLPPAEHAQVDESQLERSARVLEQKLAAFGLQGRLVEGQPGPAVPTHRFDLDSS